MSDDHNLWEKENKQGEPYINSRFLPRDNLWTVEMLQETRPKYKKTNKNPLYVSNEKLENDIFKITFTVASKNN